MAGCGAVMESTVCTISSDANRELGCGTIMRVSVCTVPSDANREQGCGVINEGRCLHRTI